MATACIPIREIKSESSRGANLVKKRAGVWAKLRILWSLPHILRFINDHLSGRSLGRLDADQAKSLYQALEPLHIRLSEFVESFSSKPLLARLTLGWWVRRVGKENDRIANTLETLAWGSDDDLREFIDAALHSIESREREASCLCLIDDQFSPDFKKHQKELFKKFRHIQTDLADAYRLISEDHEHACEAHGVPGYSNRVWKYRCECVDMERGRKGGYRILAFYIENSNTLYPFCVYTHDQHDNQPPPKDIKKWLKRLVENLKSGSAPRELEPPTDCRICGKELTPDEIDAFRDLCAIHRTAAI